MLGGSGVISRKLACKFIGKVPRLVADTDPLTTLTRSVRPAPRSSDVAGPLKNVKVSIVGVMESWPGRLSDPVVVPTIMVLVRVKGNVWFKEPLSPTLKLTTCRTA